MVDDRAKKTVITKILQSKTFSDAERSRLLLNYLAEAALKGERPKEITIAVDVLGKERNYDPNSDAYVRSSVYQLRKKLENYYESEGRKDTLRLSIPKGRYHVEFIKTHDVEPERQPGHWRWRKGVWVPAAGILLVSIIVYQAILMRQQPHRQFIKAAQHAIWEDIVSSPLPTCLAVGDVFKFVELDPVLNRWRVMTDPSIISDVDFYNYRQLYAQRRNAADSDQGGALPVSVVPSLLNLAPFIHFFDKPYISKLTSKLGWDDLSRYNIIYVGGITDLHFLHQLLDISHIRAVPVQAFNLLDDRGKVIQSFGFEVPPEPSKSYQETYAALIKLPGPNNNTIFLLIGSADNARELCAAQVIKDSFLNDLEKKFVRKFGSVPRYFEVLMKVGGFTQVGYSSEIIFLNEIKRPSNSSAAAQNDSAQNGQ